MERQLGSGGRWYMYWIGRRGSALYNHGHWTLLFSWLVFCMQSIADTRNSLRREVTWIGDMFEWNPSRGGHGAGICMGGWNRLRRRIYMQAMICQLAVSFFFSPNNLLVSISSTIWLPPYRSYKQKQCKNAQDEGQIKIRSRSQLRDLKASSVYCSWPTEEIWGVRSFQEGISSIQLAPAAFATASQAVFPEDNRTNNPLSRKVTCHQCAIAGMILNRNIYMTPNRRKLNL